MSRLQEAFNRPMPRRVVLEAMAGAAVFAALGAEKRVGAEGPQTPEMAAAKYGASAYTREARNWDINRFAQGKVIGSHLTADTSGQHHRVNTAGAVMEAWVDLHDDGEVSFFAGLNRRAMVFAVNGPAVPQMDTRGGTLWEGQGVSPELTLRQLNDKEKVEQPGALVIPVGFEPECPALVRPPEMPQTPEDAARIYGASAYSKDASHWEVKTFGNGFVKMAHLKADESGEHHRVTNLIGTVYEGSLDLEDDQEIPYFAQRNPGRRALAYVGDGTAVQTVDTKGITIWVVNNDQGYPEDRTITVKRLWDQVQEREAKSADQGGQPGVIILPFGFNPNSNQACPVDP